MGHATLMVRLALGRSNGGIIRIANDLAERLGAGVIGVAACQPIQIAYGDGYLPGEAEQIDRDQIAGEVAEAEREFRDLLSSRIAQPGFRAATTLDPLGAHFAGEARAADLILTEADHAHPFNATRHFNTADLVMRAGRPVIVAPSGADNMAFDRVLLAWKETRETRRAALDALPVMRLAQHVTVMEIASEADLPAARARLADVVQWLGRHGIDASPITVAAKGPDSVELARAVEDNGADLVIAGAYGHSRLREWVLGGVTCDLLLSSPRPVFLSH